MLQWTGKIRNWAVKFMYRRQSEMLGTGYMFLVSLCGLVVSLILVSIMMPISLMVVQNINKSVATTTPSYKPGYNSPRQALHVVQI